MAKYDPDTRLSKFISLVLRHKPEAAGITLDRYGWAEVNALLSGCNAAGKPIDMETLERIVRTDEKGRYSFSDDHTRIRANQGHSIPIDLGLTPQIPPAELYHGTATGFLNAIRAEGIRKGRRQYVHISRDVETAVKVGRRHGKPAVLVLDTGRMAEDGVVFYLSENKVWLTDYVDWKYVKDVIYP